MHFLQEYSLFFFKTITLVVAILLVVAGILAIAHKDKQKDKIVVKKLNDKLKNMAELLNEQLLNKKAFKALQKKQNKEKEPSSEDTSETARTFILKFQGDMRASAVHQLSEEITAILTVARPVDHVVVRIESAGGVVHGYGLAASQLQRIKDKGISLVACVDKVAASGGYMMACVADKIYAAPFAIIGSIGVVAQLPNFNRLLKRHHIEYEQLTAGDYKRTLTMFGENTDADRQKMQDQLEEIHTLFKNFIVKFRPQVNLEKVATGEHWFGIQAMDLDLVDTLMTSDDYLMQLAEKMDVFEITTPVKKSLGSRLSQLGEMLSNFLGRNS